VYFYSLTHMNVKGCSQPAMDGRRPQLRTLFCDELEMQRLTLAFGIIRTVHGHAGKFDGLRRWRGFRTVHGNACELDGLRGRGLFPTVYLIACELDGLRGWGLFRTIHGDAGKLAGLNRRGQLSAVGSSHHTNRDDDSQDGYGTSGE